MQGVTREFVKKEKVVGHMIMVTCMAKGWHPEVGKRNAVFVDLQGNTFWVALLMESHALHFKRSENAEKP